MHRSTRAAVLAIVVPIWCCGVAGGVNGAEQTYQFDIPAESLSQALTDFSQASSQQIIYSEDVVRGRKTPGLHGRYTGTGALNALLSGSDLQAEVNPAGVLMVRRKNVEAASSSDEAAGRQASEVETVVVTGTNLRGLKSSASPLTTYMRADIDRSGAGNLDEFLRKIPQNFGDESASTLTNIAGLDADNGSDAAGVDLRGLGSDSTLVLINGRRVAPGGYDANFVDISMIPVSAIDHVDIVPDGASAIYGSDAVGGVVNFLLRDHYDGAETRFRYGSVTSGGNHDLDASQAIGRDWGSGSALVSYDYYNQTALSAADRSISRNVALPFSLVPDMRRQSVFFSADQNFDSDIQVFSDALYSHRSDEASYNFPPSVGQRKSGIDQFTGTIGSQIRLADDQQLEFTGTYGRSETDFEFFANAALDQHQRINSELVATNAKLDGSLLHLPAGAISYALGAEYRHESLDTRNVLAATTFAPERDVFSAFGELNIPIVSPQASIPFVARVDIDLADRFEKYSDFGTTNNPKVGITWRANDALTLRATWGTSFKAPLLNDLNPEASEVVPFPIPDPLAASGFSNALLIFGGNPKLGPETARTWSVGADIAPADLAGFAAHLTYYNINFSNRIVNLAPYAFDAFIQEAVLGPTVVERNPPLAAVNELYGAPNFFNFFGIPPEDVSAIVDLRDHNLSSVKTDGLDFDVTYTFEADRFSLETGITGTYIFDFKNRITPSAPVASILNTTFNPVDLKLRGRAVLSIGSLELSEFINYTDSYQNNLVVPIQRINSWTTLDVSATYKLTDSTGPLKGVSAAVGVQNLFDSSAPFVANPVNGLGVVNYDGANASPVGRFVYFQLVKQW